MMRKSVAASLGGGGAACSKTRLIASLNSNVLSNQGKVLVEDNSLGACLLPLQPSLASNHCQTRRGSAVRQPRRVRGEGSIVIHEPDSRLVGSVTYVNTSHEKAANLVSSILFIG